MKPILINIKEALKAAGLPPERLQHDWMKRITAVDKTTDNGFSLLGEGPTKKWDCLALQTPGLYLLHDRTWKIPFRSELFELLPNATVKLIDHQVRDTKDWAVYLWQPIEQWLEAQEKLKKSLKEVIASSHDAPSPSAPGVVLGGEFGAKLKAMREGESKPFLKYLIKFAIRGYTNQPRRVRTASIDFSLVGDIEQYIEKIAIDFDLHVSEMPHVWQYKGWTYFQVKDPGDKQ